MNVIKVLSLPSRHPYTSKLNTGGVQYVNPETDLFSWGLCSPEYLNVNYPSEGYDVVHIHFSFDRLSLKELSDLLSYFKSKRKPIVWTLHSKESQRIRNYGEGKYQKLLFGNVDRIISPTKGATEWLINTFGPFHHEIPIIPLGFMSDPRDIARLSSHVVKDSKLFSMLVGEFRQNKEFLQSVVNFLQCTDLEDFKLQLIFKPMSLYDHQDKLSQEMAFFFELIQNERIVTLSKPEISNDELNAAFLRAHAVILAYRWGTHSGQLEQARDCGCHVVASNVGFYREQWEEVNLYSVNNVNSSETAKNYTNALIEVSKKPSLKPLGMTRLDELTLIIKEHVKVYDDVIEEYKSNTK